MFNKMTSQLQPVKRLGKPETVDDYNGIICIGKGIPKDQRTER